MQKIVLVLVFLVMACLWQHVSHELLHLIVGKKMGLLPIKVQWFTYHGGTKVFFEGEEEILNGSLDKDKDVPREWIWMNLAGILGTNVMAWALCLLYQFLPLGYLKLFVWEAAMVFLLTDCGYALLCAFFDCGDLYLINRLLERKDRSRAIVKAVTVFLFIGNCTLARLTW